MIRGTTPTLFFNLPFQASLIKSAEIILKYNDVNKEVIIEKNLPDCVLGESSISATLTQEETLSLPAPTSVLVQLRVLLTDETALATKTYEVPVQTLLKEGVIV